LEKDMDIKDWRLAKPGPCVRGQVRSNFDETSGGAVPHLGYAYPSAEEAEKTFKGESSHYNIRASATDRVDVSRIGSRRSGPEAALHGDRHGGGILFAARLCSVGRLVSSRPASSSVRATTSSTKLLREVRHQGSSSMAATSNQWEKSLSTKTQAVLFDRPAIRCSTSST